MISKSIITAFLLCLAYSMIAYLNLDSEIRPLNQGQGNLVKCQEYVLSLGIEKPLHPDERKKRFYSEG